MYKIQLLESFVYFILCIKSYEKGDCVIKNVLLFSLLYIKFLTNYIKRALLRNQMNLIFSYIF